MYTGTPGSGKSVHQAERLYYDNLRGCPCIANYEVDKDCLKHPELFFAMENGDITPEFLNDFAAAWWADPKHRFHEGALKVFLDECQILFNARAWNAPDRAAWIKFFTQHRKLGYDVYLICQLDQMIDKQIRSLVEYQFVHRQLNNFGIVGRFASMFALGHPIIVAVKVWYPMKERVGSEWILGRKRWYRMYDTRKLFG